MKGSNVVSRQEQAENEQIINRLYQIRLRGVAFGPDNRAVSKILWPFPEARRSRRYIVLQANSRGSGLKPALLCRPRFCLNCHSPAIHGWEQRDSMFQVPQGTADNFFRPLRDFELCRTVNPAINGRAIFKLQSFSSISPLRCCTSLDTSLI